MKLSKLRLIIAFMLFSISNIFAQNNDMKARMEYEDAETAYQNQDYSKAVTHLESAEKLLGKPTSKTRYLLILSTINVLSDKGYEYKDLEKLRNLTKHYLDNYTTDTEKYRDIYDILNDLDNNFPKTQQEYNQLVFQKLKEEQAQKKIELEEKLAELENLKQAQDYVKSLAQKYGGFVSDITVDDFAKTSLEHQAYLKGKKGDWKNDVKRLGLKSIIYDETDNTITYYNYLEAYFKSGASQEQTQEAFKKLAKEITDNIPTKYYKIYYGNNLYYEEGVDIVNFFKSFKKYDDRAVIAIKVPGVDLYGLIIEYSRHSKGTYFYISFYSNKYVVKPAYAIDWQYNILKK